MVLKTLHYSIYAMLLALLHSINRWRATFTYLDRDAPICSRIMDGSVLCDIGAHCASSGTSMVSFIACRAGQKLFDLVEINNRHH